MSEREIRLFVSRMSLALMRATFANVVWSGRDQPCLEEVDHMRDGVAG
jgi:hypothetical protein